MADPWLAIIGMGEDGPSGLSAASAAALRAADLVFGAPRLLALAGTPPAIARDWPVPFDVAPVMACRGQRVAVLASGDPFWYGAGATLAAALTPADWVCHPAPSTFGLAAAALGWRIEETACHGLHAAPLARLRRDLAPGARLIVLLRDGEAVRALAAYLASIGFGTSWLWVMEALGGPRARIRDMAADGYALAGVIHPVAVGVEVAGGPALSHAQGLADALFVHDGQITRAPIRALTLAALAPTPGEVLWDIGAGSGSVSVEFLLAAARTTAHAVEPRPARAANIAVNRDAFGLADRLQVIEAEAPAAFDGLPDPQAVFIGGGASEAILSNLWQRLAPGTRLVASAVTLETEALLIAWHAARGGNLMRIELAEAAPLGRMRGWRGAHPVVQWSVSR